MMIVREDNRAIVFVGLLAMINDNENTNVFDTTPHDELGIFREFFKLPIVSGTLEMYIMLTVLSFLLKFCSYFATQNYSDDR